MSYFFLLSFIKPRKFHTIWEIKSLGKTETQFHDLIMAPDLFPREFFSLIFYVYFIYFFALKYMKTTPHAEMSPAHPRFKYRVFQDILFPQFIIGLLRKFVKCQYVNKLCATSQRGLKSRLNP
jgi:hypothetical protein